MPFYDHIASQWHSYTGYKGGALKRFVLNDVLITAISWIENRAILELGAGNGYFLPLILRRYSGQKPARVVITDQSSRLLDLAKRHCKVRGAEYLNLDIRDGFAFEASSFDLIVATMVFNEIPRRDVASAISECRRVLGSPGQLLATVVHPDFVASLDKRGELRHKGNCLTMPGSAGLRLPIHKTTRESYEICLRNAGFEFIARDIFATKEVLSAKSGLKNADNIPLALVFNCTTAKAKT